MRQLSCFCVSCRLCEHLKSVSYLTFPSLQIFKVYLTACDRRKAAFTVSISAACLSSPRQLLSLPSSKSTSTSSVSTLAGTSVAVISFSCASSCYRFAGRGGGSDFFSTGSWISDVLVSVDVSPTGIGDGISSRTTLGTAAGRGMLSRFAASSSSSSSV